MPRTARPPPAAPGQRAWPPAVLADESGKLAHRFNGPLDVIIPGTNETIRRPIFSSVAYPGGKAHTFGMLSTTLLSVSISAYQPSPGDDWQVSPFERRQIPEQRWITPAKRPGEIGAHGASLATRQRPLRGAGLKPAFRGTGCDKAQRRTDGEGEQPDPPKKAVRLSIPPPQAGMLRPDLLPAPPRRRRTFKLAAATGTN